MEPFPSHNETIRCILLGAGATIWLSPRLFIPFQPRLAKAFCGWIKLLMFGKI